MTHDKKPHISIIVALDEKNGIGRNGAMLCHLPADLRYFKETTTSHSIIMGRKTYESLPKGALPNRTNIVITSDNEDNYPGCITVRSIDEALAYCEKEDTVFIIGGGQLYRSTLSLANRLYLTRIHHTFNEVDTFFPEINFDEWVLTQEESHLADEKNPYDYSFQTFMKK